MKFIAHRGNYLGPNPELENTQTYIEKALVRGFDVEIDVRSIKNGKVVLGHDKPQEIVDLNFLLNEKIWCHAKTVCALKKLLEYKIHCFWHQTDKFTLTSKGWIWAYPSLKITHGTIVVLPEINNLCPKNLVNCAGICSDYVEQYYICLG